MTDQTASLNDWPNCKSQWLSKSLHRGSEVYGQAIEQEHQRTTFHIIQTQEHSDSANLLDHDSLLPHIAQIPDLES